MQGIGVREDHQTRRPGIVTERLGLVFEELGHPPFQARYQQLSADYVCLVGTDPTSPLHSGCPVSRWQAAMSDSTFESVDLIKGMKYMLLMARHVYV